MGICPQAVAGVNSSVNQRIPQWGEGETRPPRECREESGSLARGLWSLKGEERGLEMQLSDRVLALHVQGSGFKSRHHTYTYTHKRSGPACDLSTQEAQASLGNFTRLCQGMKEEKLQRHSWPEVSLLPLLQSILFCQ